MKFSILVPAFLAVCVQAQLDSNIHPPRRTDILTSLAQTPVVTPTAATTPQQTQVVTLSSVPKHTGTPYHPPHNTTAVRTALGPVPSAPYRNASVPVYVAPTSVHPATTSTAAASGAGAILNAQNMEMTLGVMALVAVTLL